MNRLFRSAASALPIAAVIACTCLSSGCDRPSPAPTTLDAKRPANATYTTRGKVEALPAKDKPTSEFVVHHEAIDTFFNPAKGEIVGMDSMSMPFPNLAEGVTLDDLQVGDIIEMTFGVWYKPSPADKTKQVIEAYRVQKIQKLPKETELKFGKAQPPQKQK